MGHEKNITNKMYVYYYRKIAVKRFITIQCPYILNV